MIKKLNLIFWAATVTLQAQATHIPAAKMDAAFPKHSVLLDTPDYRVMAIGRDKDGEAEIHDKFTDVAYIVDGAATLVTGGKLKNAKTTAPGEMRGTGIEGGEKRDLKAGDVVAIPNGMPHHFTNIKACRYYLVKVRTNETGKPSLVTSISKGGALGAGDGYKLSVSHRDKPGIAEIHARDTDFMYFIKGTGTVETGGKVPESKSDAPEEVRGPKIAGGVRQPVKPGDVMVIPNTVPHQFVEVNGAVDYFVIKVRAAK